MSESCKKLVRLIVLWEAAEHAHRAAVWYGLEQLMKQLTNGQHACEFVSETKADILSILFDYHIVFGLLHKLRKWRIANAISCVDVGDRLRVCRTENIHTTNTLGFRPAMLR